MKNVHFLKEFALVLPILALCAMLVSGCSAGESYEEKTATPGLPPMNSKRADLVTADLKMRVPNVQTSERQIGQILHSAGGYIESATSADLASRYPTMKFILKIPAIHVATALDSLEGLGSPTAKSVSVQDVSDSSEGASPGSVKSPLSTVDLSLEQSMAASVGRDPEWLGQAWEEALFNASIVYRTLFVGLIWLVAFLPFLLPGFLLYWKYVRRLRRPPVAV